MLVIGFGDGPDTLVQREPPSGTCTDVVELGDQPPVFDGWGPVYY